MFQDVPPILLSAVCDVTDDMQIYDDLTDLQVYQLEPDFNLRVFATRFNDTMVTFSPDTSQGKTNFASIISGIRF